MPDKILRSFHDGRRWRAIALLIGAAVVIGIVAAWLARGDFKGRYAIPEAGSRTTPPAQVPRVSVRPALPAPVVPAAVSPADRDANVDQDEAEDENGDRIARAIDRAARRALDRGEPVRWHKAGETGYVVVSEPRDDGERVCRNVSATIDTDDGRTRSDSHLWCRTDDGEWSPAQ